MPGDRLDLITARTLGDPEQFWRICDANDALDPDDLAEPGRRLASRPDAAAMSPLLGIHLTLLIGPTVAVPAPPPTDGERSKSVEGDTQRRAAGRASRSRSASAEAASPTSSTTRCSSFRSCARSTA